jgi:predicted nucleic acid-binding protein
LTDIFLDASALVASFDERDQWRRDLLAARRALDGLPRLRLFTSNWTLYEALATVARRRHDRARQLHAYADGSVRVVRVSLETETEALRRFLAWDDSTASVVDHANLLIATSYRCDAILSFDADFAGLVGAAGMRLIGPPWAHPR